MRLVAGLDGDAPDWRDIPIPPGSLFVVGDPKQSIYRFRRADIRTYLAAQDKVGGSTALVTNFRTTAPIVAWINRVFSALMLAEEGMQPAYQALVAHRSEAGEGPAVTVLGIEPHDGAKAEELRAAEAADVAAIISRALTDRWTVLDKRSGQWRAIQPGDIAILLPARTSLPFLQVALDAANIAYRAESSSLVYQADEIRDLMAALRVIADPGDRFSCVTALRSPLFACGDDDLWSWRSGGGSFNILAPVSPDRTEHPVGRAVRFLRGLHALSRWLSPSEVLATVIEERRMLEVAAAGPRARDAWRRLRFVVDQARAWSESERGGLRGYLAWASRQADETARVAEAVLPETDVDAVRIMTVHAAKGLEFGMVVLSGMTSQPRRQTGVRVIWPPTGGYAVRLTKDVQTNDFEAALPVDEQMDGGERIRLLYVATTRARDHLVVSLHRAPRGIETNATVLANAGAADGVDTLRGEISFVPRRSRAEVDPPPDWDAWKTWIDAAQAATRRRAAVSASGLEGSEPEVVLPAIGAGGGAAGDSGSDAEVSVPADPGAAKGPRDIELPPWTKGRYGTAVGRAVHAVLQTIDLTTGEGMDQAVAAQCFAEGVTDFSSVVKDLARSALNSAIVREAATRSPMRESYVATELDDGTVLEGIVDLMYRDELGQVVIVDYKTDAVPAGALGARVEFYRPQVRTYRRAVEAAIGIQTRAVLLFLNPSGSTAVDVDT
jgi:ATP-dependent helicase/nuclease subunit A